MKSPFPFALIIMDGYANNPNPLGNAVFHARKPNLDRLFRDFPTTGLITFGERVGLPDEQMGNSEVGHLNIGAGRVVEQELTRINRTVRNHAFGENATLQRLFATLRASENAALHLIGLTSNGGVHSSLSHIEELCAECARQGVRRIFVHAITDGRDRPPTVAHEEIQPLDSLLRQLSVTHGIDARIVSIIGRYFAMDRDSRWERTEKAYKLFTAGAGEHFDTASDAFRARAAQNAQDEFLEPIALSTPPGRRAGWITDGDALLFCNFRADRMRQIVKTFLPGAPSYARPIGLSAICTLTEYEEGLVADVLFPPFLISTPLGEIISRTGLTQLRLAETEKYPHVTYFFNGGAEDPLPGEDRILVPSPRDIATYDLKPEMSAYEVTERLLERLQTSPPDVTIVNFANCDMVGHTGNFEAAVRAVETVDQCVGRVLASLHNLGGTAIVTADHGNADQMIDYETGGPHTFHTKYPVPCALFAPSEYLRALRSGGALCDIAPTICDLLRLDQPHAMTGTSLFIRPGG